MGIMALMGTPFSPEQLEEIRRTAEKQGLTLRMMEPSASYPKGALEDCEVLLGYFPRSLRKAQKI